MSELEYRLKQSYEITAALVANGGELTPELESAIAIRDLKLPNAVDRAAFLMARLEHEEAHWDALAAKYASIAKGCSRVREAMKESIKAGMRQLGIDELEGEDVRLKLSRTKAKLHFDENILDPNYIKTRQVSEVDRDQLRKDLENGLEVEGAMLIESFGLRPYPNTKKERSKGTK